MQKVEPGPEPKKKVPTLAQLFQPLANCNPLFGDLEIVSDDQGLYVEPSWTTDCLLIFIQEDKLRVFLNAVATEVRLLASTTIRASVCYRSGHLLKPHLDATLLACAAPARLGKVIALRTEQDEQDQDQEQLKTYELCLLHVARLSRPLDESASDITRSP